LKTLYPFLLIHDLFQIMLKHTEHILTLHLKMLGLYLVGQNCLHLTFEQYLSSETYSSKYEKLQNIVILACKNITEKMHLLKMSGPQIWLCLFTFRPIASKQLNGLTTIDSVSWLGGTVVTHPLWMQAVRVQSPDPARVFMFHFLLCCCCVFLFLSKTHYLSQKFAIPFTMLIYLVYLTYCKICDRL